MSLPAGDWLALHAQSDPDRLAVRADGTDVGYGELASASRRRQAWLARHGVAPRSVVAIDLPAGIEFAAWLHAAIRQRAIAMPVDQRASDAEREALLTSPRPAAVITGAERLPDGELVSVSREDLDRPLARMSTSGTTGEPRQVDLTRGNFLWSAAGSAINLGVEPDDRWLCCLPVSHIAGLSILVRSAIYGTAAVIQAGFDTDRVAAALAEDAITLVSLVPTQLRRLLAAGVDLSAPRAILVGGGPVPLELLDEATGRGARVLQTYGMTETCSQVTTLAPGEAHRYPGSAGRPLLGVELRIDQDDEVLVRGPIVAPGQIGDDGWLRTGDLGRLDASGHLYIEDRKRDLIVSGGENIRPAEVERALLSHPAVADAGVHAIPDPEWQEAVAAVVVLREGSVVGEAELREHCAGRIARFKAPKRIRFADSLPRTASGKLLRWRLSEAPGPVTIDSAPP